MEGIVLDSIKVIVVCGESEYAENIISYCNGLDRENNHVLTEIVPYDRLDGRQREVVEDSMYKKIELADEVHVLTKDLGIGESINKFLGYAKDKGKIVKILAF